MRRCCRRWAADVSSTREPARCSRGRNYPRRTRRGKKKKGKKSKDEEPRQQQQQQRKEPIRAGKWTLVEDWTPCAFGDIPAHLRGVDPGLVRVPSHDFRIGPRRREGSASAREEG